MYTNRIAPLSRRPFEDDGKFYAGHVKSVGANGRTIKRRCLCFVLAGSSIVGASVNFSRAEAYHTAQRAANGALPLPENQPNRGSLLASILKIRGFPINNVKDPQVEVDDTTAISIGREFAR